MSWFYTYDKEQKILRVWFSKTWIRVYFGEYHQISAERLGYVKPSGFRFAGITVRYGRG